ncbi:hypothetical protein QJQ45_001491 [Haematococcus lacustris]|nr:hypothetical protein QJQ45_001491 [Haematococcus lacustris]
MVFVDEREQQQQLDLLEFMQQFNQLEEAFLQQLQGTQAQLTDTAAALEATLKDLAAARTELAHTKQQLTTTSIKLEELRAQVAAANKGFSKDHKEATRFTREQLRAYLLYQKVPPRDQPVGNTLVAGWQMAVQKHIAERGSPTGHGVLP